MSMLLYLILQPKNPLMIFEVPDTESKTPDTTNFGNKSEFATRDRLNFICFVSY